MGESMRVALVRRPPPNWPLPLQNRDWTGITINISETVDVGLGLICDAKAHGANLIAFPELWFPGFPKWREQNDWKTTHLPSYIDNSLEINSPEWCTLIEGIRSIGGLWVALAFSERSEGKIYMAQSLVSPEGEIVMHRRKLRPSGSERDMFSDGTIDQLQVKNTPIGRVGMLQCGDMAFPLAAQRPKLHIGAWPFASDFDDDSDSIYYNASFVTRGSGAYALNSGAYVLMPAVGFTFIYDPLMRIVAHVDNRVDYDQCPILYHDLDIPDLHSDVAHDPNAQASWAVLQQLNDSLPNTLPHEMGSLVPQRETTVEWLKSKEMKWSEIAPGTPSPEEEEEKESS